ncbi:MAG: carboxypeptidase regulatory-like domain-containing protein, partial [Clostridia bacterium]|nr:carboxypeptidase regulatory-like domain-containing protein [Clostridia bacterium]
TAELCVRAENGIYTYTQVFDATASRDTIPLTQQNESFVPAKACGTFKVRNFDELPQPQNYSLNITTYDEDGEVLASAFTKATTEVVNLKNILPEGAAACEAEFQFSDALRNTVTLLKQTLLPDEIRAGIVSLYVDSYLAQTYGPYKLQIKPAALNGCAGLGYGDTYLSGVSDDAESLYFYLAPEVFEDGGDTLFTARITRWPEDLLDTWNMNRWNGPAVDRYEKTFSVEFERLTKNDAVFGTVTDGTDPIPFASVTATQVINNRSFSVSTVSGADGSYRIDELTNVPTSIFATAEGYKEVRKRDAALNETNDLTLAPAGRIAVTLEGGTAENVRIFWKYADMGSWDWNGYAGSGNSFVVSVPKDATYIVQAASDDFAYSATGTVTVTDGMGRLTLRPAFRPTIDWSGSNLGNNSISFHRADSSAYTRYFRNGDVPSQKVDPGTYIVEVRDPEYEVIASETVTVQAGETAYVELSVEGEDKGISGDMEAPAYAAYGEVYRITGQIDDVAGELLGISVEGVTEGIVVNGMRSKEFSGNIMDEGIDFSLPCRFTLYISQRASYSGDTTTVGVKAIVKTTENGLSVTKEVPLGYATTAYAPNLTFSVSPAVPTIEREEDGQKILSPGAVSFYGTAPSGSTIYLYDNGELAAMLTSTGAGKFEGKVQLRSGMMGHTLRAELHDAEGNAIASAEGRVTFTAQGPVPTTLIISTSSNKIPLNLNGKPISRVATESKTMFTATFENPDKLKEFTMKTSEGTWEGKVFFEVTTPTETIILPASTPDDGVTWVSEAREYTNATQPTGVHLLYQAESANEPYVASVEAGEGETEDIEIDAGYLVKLENEMTMDDWRAYFYNIEDGYDEWVAGGGTFSGGFENEDTGSLMAANDNDMYAYIAGILDKTAEMDAQAEAGTDEPVPDRHERFGTVMASTAGEITSKKDEYTYITYADKPNWDTGTEQNVNLRLKQLKLQGYTCSETTDDNGNVVLAFHKLFYYDNFHNPANRELYDGDPADWKSKATGSTLDVTYLYVKVKSGGTKGGVWMRQQTAILTPGAMSPIHTLPNDMPSTYQGPRSYRDASELQGELLWSEPGSDYSIDINKYKNAGFWFTTGKNRISTQHWGQITLSVSTFGLNKYVQALEKIPGATTTILKKGGNSLLTLESFSVANISKITGELWDSLFDTKTFGYDDYDQMFNNYLQNLNYWKDVKKFMEENNNPEYFKEINNFDIELGMVDDIINDNINMLSKISSMGRLKQAGNVVNNFTNDNANGLGKFSFAVGFVPEYGPEASLATDCNIFGQNALNDNIQADIGEVTGNFITDLSGFMERDKRMKEYIVMNNIQRRNIEGKDFVELTKMPEWMGNDPLRPKDAVIVPNHDPSGIVYEAVLSNPVEGATVTLYKYEEAAGDMVLWDDSDGLGQENPVVTDADGFYRWDVPEGEWFVRAVAAGYADGSSQNDVEAADPAHEHGGVKYLPVLPPQLNVNIPLVDDSEPVVASTEVSTDGVIITFSKYMEEAGLTAANFTLNGALIEPEKLDSEQAPDNIVYEGEAPSYTRTVRLAGTFEPGETISVTISNALKSYAGTAFAGYANDQLIVPEPAPTGITYVAETKNARAVKSSKFVTITTDEVSEEAPVLIASYDADGRFLGLVVVTEPGGSGESEGGAA